MADKDLMCSVQQNSVKDSELSQTQNLVVLKI